MSQKVFSELTHQQRVRNLFKLILKIHRSLPPEMREIGDKYVKEEFRRHKNASPEFVRPFMMEWSKYAVDLTNQLKEMSHECTKTSSKPINLGKSLDEEHLNYFNENQLKQLLILAKEIYSSESEENDERQNKS